MNFEEILDVASKNSEKEQNRSTNFFNNVLPPAKKEHKSAVQSNGVKAYLARIKAMEEAKAAEEQRKKEHLLSLRAQSTKNNKKAKIMASRTKDNDFSRIRLTEDQIESKKKIERELQQKQLADKVERMKARIELEEKEKLLPRKRKRKNKPNEEDKGEQGVENEPESQKGFKIDSKSHDKSVPRKAPRPPPPAMSFTDLLKVAEVKQFEPVNIPKKKKEEDTLMTKKQRKLHIEEQERQRRLMERVKRDVPSSSKASHSVKSSEKKSTTKPVVIHAKKTGDSQGLKSQTNSNSIPKIASKSSMPVCKTSKPSSNQTLHTNHDRDKPSKMVRPPEKNSRPNAKEDSRLSVKKPVVAKTAQKPASKSAVAEKPPPQMPVIDTDAIVKDMEKRLREKLEKEMEQRMQEMVSKFTTQAPSSSSVVKPPVNTGLPKQQHVQQPNAPLVKKKLPPFPVRDGRPVNQKPPLSANVVKKSAPPSIPQKKPFHPNPYLDPPRRRLEPLLRPQKTIPKRRIESDDDESDDDMDDFIDDSIDNQNEENYSKYIKEIFQYDRNKYTDDDDDDIRETNFADQLKEETRSARLGYLEDLEEERKLREIEKKRKMKHKK